MTSKGKILRNLLITEDLLMAPGAYDAWSARMIERAGFRAAYMTGYGIAASVLGMPDIGLMSMSETVQMAKNMANAIDIPLICDADTGYGNSLNVVRTVREFELAGVAAIQLEDQVFPKRCGHMDGKQVIPKEEMVAKIRAAVYARKDPDLVLIARSDANAVNGFDDALDRCRAYVEAGADVIFFEAPRSREELSRVAQTLRVPLLANMVEGGATPLFSRQELIGMHYKLAIYPVTALYAATKAMEEALATLSQTGSNQASLGMCKDHPTFFKMIGVQEMRDLEKTFLHPGL